MGEAARNLEPFDEAYARADWSRFEHLPLFSAANRMNAYNTYLLMEQSGHEAAPRPLPPAGRHRRRPLGAGCRRAVAAPAAPGEAVAWPEVTLLDGSRFGPAQAAGRALVVVFWSTTCPFCRRHNEHVEKLHRAAAGRRLAVLGVSRDRDVAAVRRHAREHGYTFPITTDQAPLAAALSARRASFRSPSPSTARGGCCR